MDDQEDYELTDDIIEILNQANQQWQQLQQEADHHHQQNQQSLQRPQLQEDHQQQTEDRMRGVNPENWLYPENASSEAVASK